MPGCLSLSYSYLYEVKREKASKSEKQQIIASSLRPSNSIVLFYIFWIVDNILRLCWILCRVSLLKLKTGNTISMELHCTPLVGWMERKIILYIPSVSLFPSENDNIVIFRNENNILFLFLLYFGCRFFSSIQFFNEPWFER